MDSNNNSGNNSNDNRPKVNRGVSPSIGGWGQFSRPGGSGVTRLGSFKQHPNLSLKNPPKPEFSPLIPSEKSKAKTATSTSSTAAAAGSEKSKDGFISTPISVSSQQQQKLYMQQQRREQAKRQFRQQPNSRFVPQPSNLQPVKSEPTDDVTMAPIDDNNNDTAIETGEPAITSEVNLMENDDTEKSEKVNEDEKMVDVEGEEEEKIDDFIPQDYNPWDPEDPVQLPMIDPKDPIGSIKAQKRNRLTATATNVDPSIALAQTGRVDRHAVDAASIPFHDKAGQIMSNELFFVQLPSQLPTKPPPLSVTAAAAAAATSSSSVNNSGNFGNSSSQKQQQQNMFEKIHEFEIPPFVGNLSDVEGLVGKLQIRKSGKVTLVLTNGVTFDVEQGMTPKICEDLFVLSKTSAQCIHMGDISGHVMIMPNTDSLGLTNSMKSEK